MENYLQLLGILLSFGIVALASKKIGTFFTRYNLPLISGFLFAGVLVGPYVLKMIPHEAIEKLRFVDEISLAFIAFAAGSELYLKELRSRFKSIAWVTTGLVLSTSILGSLAFFFLTDHIPFTQDMDITSRVAVSILVGAILVARSPSSAIAIVNELRAKGPFTQTLLGVTVIMDVVVIVLFAFNTEIAGALLSNLSVNITFVVLLFGELSLSVLLGYLLGKAIHKMLHLKTSRTLKGIILLLLGYSVFLSATFLRHYTHDHLGIEILLEPLLICMISSFYVINWTPHRDQLIRILHDISPPIYIAFFTLTGASLALDVLAQTWQIALALFFIRLFSIFIGSFTGGTIAREPFKNNAVSWMSYVTQAGVGLGLAKEVAVKFPQFGVNFSTIIIAVIVLNQIVGPPLFKWVITHIGETHPRGQSTFDGSYDAFIFGTDDQALAVSRLLKTKNWNVKWICTDKTSDLAAPHSVEDPLTILPHLNLEAFETIDAAKADAVITMLSDEENYQICEIFYENYGTKTMVTRLNNIENRNKFIDLDVLLVYPGTATIRLLDQYARKPETTSLIMGTESKTKIREVSVRDPNLHGIALRDLRLPTDTLIIAIHRGGNDIVSHGYTRLRLGDIVTVVGSEEHLEEVNLKLEVT